MFDSSARHDLSIKAGTQGALSPAQLEFNKQLTALEKARAALVRKQARFDRDQATCSTKLMPLLEARNRAECSLVHAMAEALGQVKLTARRRSAMEDLIRMKATDLIDDPVGLDDAGIAALEAVLAEFDDGDEVDVGMLPDEQEKFDAMRSVLENMTRAMGLEIDLEGLDFAMDPEDMERELHQRLRGSLPGFQHADGVRQPRKRKPGKAALERERLRKEAEEAKQRDFKTLYKQLAKVLHPDLESDPALKTRKLEWMQRLTTAHAAGDLRDMLMIEMEWLGGEVANLAAASESKLRVYAMALKEQVATVRQQSQNLIAEPQYGILRRFMGPFGDRLETTITRFRIQNQHAELIDVLATLKRGGAAARKMIEQSADHHARWAGI